MVYYGSTYKDINKRFKEHIACYKSKDNNITVYKIFDTYGIENCIIELVEKYNCNSKRELELREGYYIKNNECINIKVLGKTRREYYDENLEAIKAKKNEWEEANKQKRKEQMKKWKEANKEKYQEYQRQYKEKVKQKIDEI
jgi:hypothetical protein